MDSMNRERTLQEAARRYARLHAMDCSQEERDATKDWLAESPEHRSAYELAERVVADVGALARDPGMGQKLRALADEALTYEGYSAHAVQSPRRWRIAAGLAASLAIAVLVWQSSSPTITDSPQTV